jgi:hypothetical protein
MRHELVGNTLVIEEGGIIGRCTCGYETGHRFTSLVASAIFQRHQDEMAMAIEVDEDATITRDTKP